MTGANGLFESLQVVVDGSIPFLRQVRQIGAPHSLNIGMCVSSSTQALLVEALPATPSLSSMKFRQAEKQEIPIVSIDFLRTCVQEQTLLHAKDFDLRTHATKKASPEFSNHGQSPSNENASDRESSLTERQAVTAPASLSEGWREARIFLSSTFRDMHGERDYLTRFVFPELQERCEALRVHVSIIDLRWGVTEEQAENGSAIELCLDQVQKCRPFFVGLLGTRYGWVPDLIPAPVKQRFPWAQVGTSMTHMEMQLAALLPHSSDDQSSRYRPLIYIRDSTFLRDVPGEFAGDFMPESPQAEKQLNRLKEELGRAGVVQLSSYGCQWRGERDGKPMTGQLEELGGHLLESLWTQMQEEFPVAAQETTSPLARMRQEHAHAIEQNSRCFVGRTHLLQELRQQSTNPHSSTPLVVVGLPGSGKTSLMATFTRSMATMETPVIYHFVGSVKDSTSLRLMLRRFCQEMWSLWNLGDIEDVPQDYEEVEREFLHLVQLKEETESCSVILIIDAINQLDDVHSPWLLQWLPLTTRPQVKIVLSTLKGKYFDQLEALGFNQLFQVRPLTTQESQAIIETRLRQHAKTLSSKQMSLLLAKTDANRPLYLTMVCEELRVFGVFEKLERYIGSMAATVPELFAQILLRLETDLGRTHVQALFALLASSRQGLSSTECSQLLGAWEDAVMPTLDALQPLNPKEWQRLERGVKAYLNYSGDSDNPRITFFHEQLLFAVRRLYLVPPTDDALGRNPTKELTERYDDIPLVRRAHYKLADYFHLLADPQQKGAWDGSARGLSEMPYHATRARQWARVVTSLCDLVFIERKVQAGLVFGLLEDLLFLLSEEHEGVVRQGYSLQVEEGHVAWQKAQEFYRFLKARTHVLHRRPHLTFPAAINLPTQSHPCQAAQARWDAGFETRPHLRWVNKPEHPESCVMTLYGHTSVVSSCAISPASQPLIASSSHDLSVRVWNSDTGEPIATMNGHTRTVQHCAFSPDGSRLVSCSWDKRVIVWDMSTFQQMQAFTDYTSPVFSAAFSADGAFLVTGDRKGQIHRYHLQSGDAVVEKRHSAEVLCIKFSHSGHLLATTSGDKSAVLRDPNTLEPLDGGTLRDHTRAVNCCAFSPDDKWLATCSDDRTVCVYNLEDWSNLSSPKILQAHNDGVVTVAFHPTKPYLLSGSHDNLIVLWDYVSGEKLATFLGHTGSVFTCAFYPGEDDRRFVSCSFDRSVKVWEVTDQFISPKAQASLADVHQGRILGVSCARNGKRIATASRDKTAKMWGPFALGANKKQGHTADHSSGVLCTMSGHQSNVFGCALSPDGQYLATASRDGTVRQWNASTGQLLYTWEDHKGPVYGCVYSPDGSRLVSCGEDKLVIIRDTTTHEHAGTLYGHRDAVMCVAYSPDGEKILTGSKDLTLKLWDAQRRRKLATYCGHEKAVRCCGFSPDSKRIISGADDRVIIEWSALNAKRLAIIQGHDEAITGCGYSIDGRYLLTGSTDSMAVMWDAVTKREVASFSCLGRVTCLDPSAFGASFAVGDGSGNLYLLAPVGESEVKP